MFAVIYNGYIVATDTDLDRANDKAEVLDFKHDVFHRVERVSAEARVYEGPDNVYARRNNDGAWAV